MKNSPAWENLNKHLAEFDQTSITDLFKQDTQSDNKRFDEFSLSYLSQSNNGLLLDYSKNRLTSETLSLLISLAEQQNLKSAIDLMFTGDAINSSENKPALHTALRAPANAKINANGESITSQVQACLNKMYAFADKLSAGELKGYTGKTIKNLVSIGIGGSDLGPRFVIDSLRPFHHDSSSDPVKVHFISNVDASDLHQSVGHLELDECIFLIASKSFTTQETLLNATTIKNRYLQDGASETDLDKHFIAVSTNETAAMAFGIKPDNIFPMWDWVGGRYSLWSAIGLPILVAIGKQNFNLLLEGANEMDEHFRQAELSQNMPVIMGLLAIWYQNFFDAKSQAILPYDHNLKLLPEYLQQLDMESLGKSVNHAGEKVDYFTGAIIWGGAGTKGQHAFHQLLHQGTHLIPADFIVAKKSAHAEDEHQQWLYANCLAQSQALMEGTEAGTATEKHKQLPGNRPSNTIVMESLNPKSLGALIALYEHRVFVQATILEINAFDQWGVELGKKLSASINESLSSDKGEFDSSTSGLIKIFKE